MDLIVCKMLERIPVTQKERHMVVEDIKSRLANGECGDDVPIVMEALGCDYSAACEAVFAGKNAALTLLDATLYGSADGMPVKSRDNPKGGSMGEELTLYHGSANAVLLDTLLSGRGDAYERDWLVTDFYSVLEMHRPENKLAHKNAVFLVGDPDDIDAAGGATDWCFEVLVKEVVSRHDLNWCTEISCLVSNGYSAESTEVQDAALAYWEGREHKDAPVWEYLTKVARVVRCEPFDSFDVEHDNRAMLAARFVSPSDSSVSNSGVELGASYKEEQTFSTSRLESNIKNIFVFGSNRAGRHGKGAALFAKENHGAIYGNGEGLQGNSYAIPTKDTNIKTLPLTEIALAVSRFKEFARSNTHMIFEVTPIGCGLAGYKPEQIAHFFKGSPPNCQLPVDFINVLKIKDTSPSLDM